MIFMFRLAGISTQSRPCLPRPIRCLRAGHKGGARFRNTRDWASIQKWLSRMTFFYQGHESVLVMSSVEDRNSINNRKNSALAGKRAVAISVKKRAIQRLWLEFVPAGRVSQDFYGIHGRRDSLNRQFLRR